MLKVLFLALIFTFNSHATCINLTLADNLFVRVPVPKKGIVCSNQGRAERISKVLNNCQTYEIPWGPKIYIGDYRGEEFFIASAPVGSGSGLMFTELYSAGAEFIVRYGSDDVKNPPKNELDMVKIIDETDNLYGFNMASGVPEDEWGKSVFASPKIIDALRDEAVSRHLPVEKRICHHLENYHSLRSPEKFSPDRKAILQKHLQKLKRSDKKESLDMESAVLFRVAKDFDKHAASVLQTVDKENSKVGPYEGDNKKKAIMLENRFVEYILSALLRIDPRGM